MDMNEANALAHHAAMTWNFRLDKFLYFADYGTGSSGFDIYARKEERGHRRTRIGEFSFMCFRDGELDLEDIHIFENYRNKGVASSLISHLIKCCIDHRVTVTVMAGYTNYGSRPKGFTKKNLISWYRKFGFKFTREFGRIVLKNDLDVLRHSIRMMNMKWQYRDERSQPQVDKFNLANLLDCHAGGPKPSPYRSTAVDDPRRGARTVNEIEVIFTR